MTDITVESYRNVISEEYFATYNWFMTFTFKSKKYDINKVNKILHSMLKDVRERLFGRHVARHINGYDDIMCLGSIERHTDNSIHIHLVLKKPSVKHMFQAKNKEVGTRADKHLKTFWVDKKKLGYMVEVKSLLGRKNILGAMNYILKDTSEKNSNFFLAYWDGSLELLASDCKNKAAF